MEFDKQLADYVEKAVRKCQVECLGAAQQFAAALDAWLRSIWADMPTNWRDTWEAFVKDCELQGVKIQEASSKAMVAWLAERERLRKAGRVTKPGAMQLAAISAAATTSIADTTPPGKERISSISADNRSWYKKLWDESRYIWNTDPVADHWTTINGKTYYIPAPNYEGVEGDVARIVHRGVLPVVRGVKEGLKGVFYDLPVGAFHHIVHPVDAVSEDIEALTNLPLLFSAWDELTETQRIDLLVEAGISGIIAKHVAAATAEQLIQQAGKTKAAKLLLQSPRLRGLAGAESLATKPSALLDSEPIVVRVDAGTVAKAYVGSGVSGTGEVIPKSPELFDLESYLNPKTPFPPEEAKPLQRPGDSFRNNSNNRQLRLFPEEPYDRAKHYPNTPKRSDRKALGAGRSQVIDHAPPLVQRYYNGDPAIGEKSGFNMTDNERAATASDRSRMKVQSDKDSQRQGADMSRDAREQKEKYGFDE